MDEGTTKINIMELYQLKTLFREFDENVRFEHDLKKKIGLTLVEKQKFFLKQTISMN